MSKLDALEEQIERLSPAELADFRRWFAEFDAARWDQQFEADAVAGRLAEAAARAQRAHAAGQSTRL